MSSNYYSAAQQALHQWAQWCRKPQFYAQLRQIGMFAMFPLPRESRPHHDIKLDPFSRRIHSAVMMLPDRDAGVLWAYYVRGVNYESNPEPFRAHGMAKRNFYDVLERATLMAYNRARSS